ncbi:hypothetical protein G7072_07785 [Nocardioides sp. HDW12B]|uniref:hypothetical protein n=1 Tax=Nocardioides sp. HDW12B TaxID=2714939 RepID=UPI00140D4440|nr:hypothetical protein [Nocardioides sp. HDW12B]QIK66260.1 hypothetical protein G7072_07785 [Nocardioides sp. HDW12B]
MTDDLVKVLVRFRGPDRPLRGEWLWARPVDAGPDCGTYALQTSSFLVPLAALDVVRAERNGEDDLQLVDVLAPSDAVWTAFLTRPGTDGATLRQMGDRWHESGAAWTERSGAAALVSTWPGMPVADVIAAMAPDVRAGHGNLVAVVTPQHRRRGFQLDIDFEPAAPSHSVPQPRSRSSRSLMNV